jgi:cellulose synthase/poly-beta-1,6-N-acetylglucosamine synthase-like glycosyltransferase
MARQIAVAIPARNEAATLPSCVAALARASSYSRTQTITVVVLANNCDDGTAATVANLAIDNRLELRVIDRQLPPASAHAGVARRLALDSAAALLRQPGDLLFSTDADTEVADDWFARTESHFDLGYDAVAGIVRFKPRELRDLPATLRARLAAVRRYDHAISRLRAMRDVGEPWPRHFYEGGASIALTLGAYHAIGGAPMPSVGEDKALLDAVVRTGGRVRHPPDVRVWTSPRLVGRAPGGTSDTLAMWGRLSEDEPVIGLKTIAEHLNVGTMPYQGLTFRQLPAEIERARALVRHACELRRLAVSA